MRSVCGHELIGPSGVFDQSIDRMSAPISPPPTSQSCFDSDIGERCANQTSVPINKVAEAETELILASHAQRLKRANDRQGKTFPYNDRRIAGRSLDDLIRAKRRRRPDREAGAREYVLGSREDGRPAGGAVIFPAASPRGRIANVWMGESP